MKFFMVTRDNRQYFMVYFVRVQSLFCPFFHYIQLFAK